MRGSSEEFYKKLDERGDGICLSERDANDIALMEGVQRGILGAYLLPGDLHLEALGLGFDETAAARRTLDHYDPDLSCGCPADCAQHPWWPRR